MTTHSKAEALVLAVLEGEDPKDFIQRHLPEIERQKGVKRVADYDLEDIGIDHCQYFQGRGTSHTDWDDVYVGTGDNPAESISDALDSAAMDGWIVEGIDTSRFGETPSVNDEIRDQAMDEARGQLNVADFEEHQDYVDALNELVDEILENGESELYYYTAVYLREPKPGETHHTVAEAEDPKDFLRRMREEPPLPPTWPKFKRWTRKHFDNDYRRAFHMVKRHNIRRNPDGSIARDPEGMAIYDPYEQRKGLKASKFWRNKARGEHSLEYHSTNVLKWDRYGNATVDTGGYHTMTTRERINTFLPHSWRVMTFQNVWYWYNHEWPQNVRDRLMSDQTARRRPNFPWWVPFNRGDTVKPDGTLIFGEGRDAASKRGLAKPDGSLKLEMWPEMRPPPAGVLHPPRRGRRNAYDPNQLLMQLEGQYLRRLARWKRIQAKHARLKQVEKQKRELEKIDEPDKKKPKKGHQNLR